MDSKVTPGPAKSPLSVVLAQVNPTVGDIHSNAHLIRESVTSAMKTASVDLILFGEMVLTGYPIEDLALRKDFQQASMKAISQLALDLEVDGNGEAHVHAGHQ